MYRHDTSKGYSGRTARTEGGKWTTAAAMSCSAAWPRRSGPSRSRTRRGSPSTDRPPRARPRWRTSLPSSCARGAAKSSARRSKTSLRPGHTAIGAARTRPRAAITTASTSTRCTGSCSIRWARAETDGSSGRSTTKVTDTARSEPVTTAPADAVLVFDGVFLLRPELMDRWDLRIFVSVPFEKTVDRARTRDQTPFRSAAEVERRYRSRYLPSQQFYFDTVRPADHADII